MQARNRFASVCAGLLVIVLSAGCSSEDSPTEPSSGRYALDRAWGTLGSGDGQFTNPWDVAVDAAGDVYVVDRGNQRIEKFSRGGAYLAQWGDSCAAAGQFDAPRQLAIDADDDIYVTDIGLDRVQRFKGDGTFVTQWGGPGSGNAVASTMRSSVGSHGSTQTSGPRSGRVLRQVSRSELDLLDN